MKQGYTEILMIIDKSGSMEHLTSDTVGGVNSFIASQKSQPGQANLSVLLFSESVRYWQSGVDVKVVPEFTAKEYREGGMNNTALLDAIGIGVTELGQRLALMDESDRPEKVLVAILTDGEENASREYKHDQIKTLIADQETKYSWDFVFMAAGPEAFAASQGLGLSRSKSLQYASNKVNTNAAYDTLAAYSGLLRSAAGNAKDASSAVDLSAVFTKNGGKAST